MSTAPAWGAARGGALVIGGDYRGLGIVRSLGRRGIPVWVLYDEHRIAATSRYARRAFRWPAESEQAQLDFLLDLAARFGLDGWAVFPTGDNAGALLARHHALLAERFRLTVPPWEVYRWAYDKRLTYQLAAELGIDYPPTWYPCGREDLAALECTFPVILKPASKPALNRFTHAKAWLAGSRSELLARYEEATTLVPPELIMVQALVPGGGETQLSYAALCLDGSVRASIIARRLRQYPIDFGRSSTYVESIDQPEIEAAGRRLLQALRFSGLIEIEFKRDPRDGRYKLLEMNPRVWGWHTLGRLAGVDFPYLQWRAAHGLPVPELRARAGARWIHLVLDIPAVYRELRAGRLTLRAYLRSLRPPLERAIIARDDLWPALLELPLLGWVGWQRRAAGGTSAHCVGAAVAGAGLALAGRAPGRRPTMPDEARR